MANQTFESCVATAFASALLACSLSRQAKQPAKTKVKPKLNEVGPPASAILDCKMLCTERKGGRTRAQRSAMAASMEVPIMRGWKASCKAADRPRPVLG